MNRYKIHWQVAADGANQTFQNILQRRKKCQIFHFPGRAN